MRINELCESNDFNDLNFVKFEGDKKEIDFDLSDDLTFFMNHDDDVYRTHLHPAITKCISIANRKRPTRPSIFEFAVREGYNEYLKKYPIRELPEDLDEEMLSEICTKIHDEVCKHLADGKYKD